MMDSYFPIGTVIQTKGSIIQFMIIGYNFKKDGKVINSSKKIKKGDKLNIEFSDGSIDTEVL